MSSLPGFDEWVARDPRDGDQSALEVERLARIYTEAFDAAYTAIEVASVYYSLPKEKRSAVAELFADLVVGQEECT